MIAVCTGNIILENKQRTEIDMQNKDKIDFLFIVTEQTEIESNTHIQTTGFEIWFWLWNELKQKENWNALNRSSKIETQLTDREYEHLRLAV